MGLAQPGSIKPEPFGRVRPAAAMLPPGVYAGLVALRRRPGERGPKKAPTKLRVSRRLSRDMVSTCRATGDGFHGYGAFKPQRKAPDTPW